MRRNFAISILVIVISFGLLLGYAEGGTNIIEFKKKYVINSPDVCDDNLCDEDSEEVYSSSDRKNRHSPMGQYKLGIPVYKITCKPDLSFVLKLSNWHPACVKPENVQRLVDSGWAANIEEKNNIFAAMTEKQDPQFKPLKEYRKEYPLYDGLGMEITHEFIAGEPYLIFDGYGWHRFHNLEITISNESGEVEFMMSQTDERGDLYLPWKIPDTTPSGWYHVYATDGINEYEIDFPITISKSFSKLDFNNNPRIGQKFTIMLNEPDANLDSDDVDRIPLSQIKFKTKNGIRTTLANPAFDANSNFLLETGENTNMFTVQIKIPRTIDGDVIHIGSWFELTYIDNSSPSGTAEDIEVRGRIG